MTDYSVEGDTLSIRGCEYTFPEEISDTIEVNHSIIVLLDTIGRKSLSRNVICIDPDEGELWKIERTHSEDPYTNIRVSEGNLWAYNWDGFEYMIDLHSGEHIDKRYLK